MTSQSRGQPYGLYRQNRNCHGRWAGPGLSYASELARLGAHVLISDIGADSQGAAADASVALDAAQALAAQGYSVIGHHGELVSEAGCRQLVETAVEAFGQLDIVIHNAGWVGYQAIEEAQPEFIERTLGVNVYSPIWLCKHAWPYLRQSSAARVVLTSSDRAMYQPYAQPGLTAYAAGKMAQLGIMNALSMEGAVDGILVNAISPVAKTRMWGVNGEPDNLKPPVGDPGGDLSGLGSVPGQRLYFAGQQWPVHGNPLCREPGGGLPPGSGPDQGRQRRAGRPAVGADQGVLRPGSVGLIVLNT